MAEASPPKLLGLATAVPPYRLGQPEIATVSRQLFNGQRMEIERLMPIYANAGIETRYSCVPLEWYLEPAGWKESNRLYVENAERLLVATTDRALADAGCEPEEIDAIVAVSTSGISTPSLDARLMNLLPFRPDVHRLPIFGLGCAGGVLGLARAAAMAQSRPGSKVLFLVVELCGLTFRNQDRSKSNMIATALFGDGAAAAVISCDPRSDAPSLEAWGEHTWPDSLDVMGWHIEEDGLGVLFSRDIPTLVRDRFRDVAENFLGRHGRRLSDVGGFVCHPGGAKVMDALEEVLGAEAGGMTTAREVLRDYGNMSAATVLFVLHRSLAKGARGEQLMSALGPGFTAAFMLVQP